MMGTYFNMTNADIFHNILLRLDFVKYLQCDKNDK